MDTLIIGNQSDQKINDRLLRVWKSGKAEHAARLDFMNLDDAWKLLSDKRRAVMHAMAGAGPLSIREIARRVGRDVRAVHSDVRLLHHAGVVDRTDDGRMILPYKTIKFDFTLEARRAA
ncbi:MAG: transcriptional regulator [Acetobacteraceae bacterium]